MATKHRVLFVDDERLIVLMVKRALKDEPYELLTATSAEQAQKLLARKPVDVLVTDERMPGMSGLDLLEWVRRRWPDTKRVVLTAYASVEMAVRAVNDGEIHRFLIKPCTTADLKHTIDEAIMRKDQMATAVEVLHVLQSEAELDILPPADRR